jgi:hypothetical protein
MVTVTRSAPDTRNAHESHHGFCTVCGSVWPCSRAAHPQPRHPIPVPRADVLSRS